MIGCWGSYIAILAVWTFQSDKSCHPFNLTSGRIHANAETGRLEYSILYYKADRNGGDFIRPRLSTGSPGLDTMRTRFLRFIAI